MSYTRGISLVDLIGLPPGSTMYLPDALMRQLDKLAVQDYSATTVGDVHVYRGTLLSLGDAWLPFLQSARVQLPMVNTGLPFQLMRRRATAGLGQNVEPHPTGWQLDLLLNRVSIVMPGLRPARRVESNGTNPRHLVPHPERSDVRIVGGGTLRLVSTGGMPRAFFIGPPDPLDPDAAVGGPAAGSALLDGVAELSFDPPHFFFGQSDMGMTVDRLVFDSDPNFTPADIEARGHGADWEGVSIREATFYAPRNLPVVGDLSGGVRDLLLGQPKGLQGELSLEFGLSKSGPPNLVFNQNEVQGGQVVLQVHGGGTLVTYTKLDGVDHGLLKCGLADSSLQCQFTLPDGSVVRGVTSGWFEARDGNRLGVQTIEVGDDGKEALSRVHEFRFKEGLPAQVPTIAVSFPQRPEPVQLPDPADFDDVLFISGRREELLGLCFTAKAEAGIDVAQLEWRFGAGIGAETHTGESFSPHIPDTLGNIHLLLRDSGKRERRLRMEVVTAGPLVLGCASGAWVVDDKPEARKLNLCGLEGVYEQASFKSEGMLKPTPSDAEYNPVTGQIESSNGTGCTVMEVTLDMGHPDMGPFADPPDAPLPSVRRHVQVLMEYGSTEPLKWGMAGLAKPMTVANVQEWAAQFGPGANFVVIGRACDIGDDEYNAELARLRALAGADLLRSDKLMAGQQIFVRGEYDKPLDAEAQAAEASTQPAMTAEERASGSLIAAEHPELYGGDQYLPPRMLYRRVDIYVVGGSDAEAQDKLVDENTRVGPALRRALLPGADLLIPVIPLPGSAPKSYSVRLAVKWDSPTVVNLADAVPTQAEVRVRWKNPPPKLDLPNGPDDEKQALLEGPSTYELLGHWAYDSRSGATRFSMAFNNDSDANGLFRLNSRVLASAALLAPALLSGMKPAADANTAARLGALILAATGAAKFATAGRVIVHGVQIQEDQRGLGRFRDATHRLLVDYTAELSLNVNQGPVQIRTTNPLKVRFKNCGVEVDTSRSPLDAVSLNYDEAQFDVADPGEWKLDGNLGKLLRVAGTRAGSGSVWFEIDLEFALDLGPVKISTATVRVTFPTAQGDSPGVELRGLGVELNVPKVLEGSGRLSVGAQGSFKSDIRVKVIPAQLEARATLVLSPTFNQLEVAVLLPMGIPLAATGVGIFGFLGRFVINGRRDIATTGDPVDNEIAWYRKDGLLKYTGDNAQGQYSLGLGVVLGTLPDKGFMLNATGMFTVAFPDPELVISLDGRLACQPTLQASEKGSDSNLNSLQLLGIIVANPQEFLLAIRGGYEVPKVLKIEGGISGWFPIKQPGKAYYLRVGSDGLEGRGGSPVTATLLPGLMDFKCWMYLMVEEKGMQNLGGAERWGAKRINLEGFSVGLGAGFDIDWAAGPFSVHASAAFILGAGSRPFTLVGLIAAEGELDLVLVSATVQAYVQGQIQRIGSNTTYWLDGEFKAEVDLGLCTVSGAVHFHAANGDGATPPEPEHPLLRVDLVDRHGVPCGSAERGSAGSTVWPDTTPVLQFAHPLLNALPGDCAFKPGTPLPGPLWCGSTELKYIYRLKSLVLRPKNGSPLAGKLDSVWWWPTHKGGLIAPQEPLASGHEARALALLSWNPGLGAVSMVNGGQDGPGTPEGTLDDVCALPVTAGRNLVQGRTAIGQGTGKVKMVPAAPGEGTLPTWFELQGSASALGKDYATLVMLAPSQGFTVVPGEVLNFASPLSVAGESTPFTGAWELPRVDQQGYFGSTMQFDAEMLNPINAPSLTLAVWDRGDRVPIEETQCDRFTDLKVGDKLPPLTMRNGWCYGSVYPFDQPLTAVDRYAPGADGRRELSCSSALGFGVSFGKLVKRVKIELVQWIQTVTILAYNATGGLVKQVQVQRLDGQPQVIELEVPGGIMVVHLVRSGSAATGGSGTSVGNFNQVDLGDFVVREFCAITEAPPPAPTAPPVLGRHTMYGSLMAWPVQALGSAPAPGGGTLQLYRYRPDPTKIWKVLRIPTYDRAHVLLLGLSGVDWMMQNLAEQNEAAKQDIQQQLGENGNPGPGGEPVTAKHLLLTPGTSYELEVEIEYAAWLKKDDGPSTPPTVADLDEQKLWKKFLTEPKRVFNFSIAPLGLAANALKAPADFHDESNFDPRALQRYLHSVQPNGALPHFLDDVLEVKFLIDYADRLAQMYQRQLVLKLRRTDPPAGTLVKPADTKNGEPAQEFQTPADLPIVVVLADLDFGELPLADQWLASLDAAPCIQAQGPAGKKAQITADLEPDAEYDLMLVAAPQDKPQSDEVLVTRAHFRSSRYRQPRDMLEALGLSLQQPNRLRPPDLMLSLPAPQLSLAGTLPLARDLELEATLRQLDLEPLPVPAQPQFRLLWAMVGGTPMLCGAVVDSLEPTYREQRMQPGRLQLERPNAATLPFTLLRSNASGTRLLYWTNTPVAPPQGAVLALEFLDRGTSRWGRRMAPTLPRALQEEAVI